MMARRWVAAILAVLLLVLAAIPAPVGAQVAPGPFVKQAFDLLMDRFVVPPISTTLLTGGWSGGLDFLKEATGAEQSISAPAFSGDRNADWSAFLAAYPQLTAAGGASLDQHGLDYAIVSGMAKSLNSTHTFLAPAPPQLNQPYGGIGVTFSSELVVAEVYPGTPAEAAGIRLGDRLIAVDGDSVEGLKTDDVAPRVRGGVGSPVKLSFRRGAQAEPVVLTLTRAEIRVPWASARLLDGGIGILRILSFPGPDALSQFDQAVAQLEQADVKALIIDVRGNGGGFYATANRVISRFVREGPISQTADRQGQSRTANADGSAWSRTIPIAVLVNDRTGAAAELTAAALRESGVAEQLVGTHTRGWLAGGQTFPLQDGSSLNIAFLTQRTGKGAEIEHVGLDPDLPVELDFTALAEGRDTQLEAALDYLRGKITR
jgi:carboxyl-terminal processing protease